MYTCCRPTCIVVLFCVVGLCCCSVSPYCFHSPTSQMCAPGSSHQSPHLFHQPFPSNSPVFVNSLLLPLGGAVAELWLSSLGLCLLLLCWLLVYGCLWICL